MDADFIENYIKSLDLHEIQDDEIRKDVESIIREYLEKAQMSDTFRKISLIQELIKWLKEDYANPSLVEAIEHVQSKLEEKKRYGLPTLTRLFEFAPGGTEYRVPPVFFEHPELEKIRVLKLIKEGGKNKIVDTEVVNVNQLKIHYVIGNLDKKPIEKEERLSKILCGRVWYDFENRCRYILINAKRTEYNHDFTVKEVNGTFHLSPNSISLRVVPQSIDQSFKRRGGILFCPSCYNLYDDDEISEEYFSEIQNRIQDKIRNLAILDGLKQSCFCPYCSRKALKSNDLEEIHKSLLFSYLYRSNFYPDVVPLATRSAYVDEKTMKRIRHKDKTLASLLGTPMFTSSANINELLEGFTRIIGIHNSEEGPEKAVCLWQKRNLRKGDKNIYYYYRIVVEGEERHIPAKISIKTENTDALSFKISDLYDVPAKSLKPSLLIDLIFSSIRILLGGEFPKANLFALNSAYETFFSYYLLTREMRIQKKSEEVFEDVFKCLTDLHTELCEISGSCKNQNVEFQLSSLPSFRHLIGNLPADLSKLHEKVSFQNGEENLQISRKMALIFWLFGVGHKRGNLYISSNKRHAGLDLDVLLEKILNHIGNLGFKKIIKDFQADIYLHTLSHLLYRSAIEVSKCDENDVSYDYNQSRVITIYDNYPGGAGFIGECLECLDNLEHGKKVRPKFGLLQQLELDSSVCMNYLVNLLIYEGISSFKLGDLRNQIDSDPRFILEKIKSTFNITEPVYERVISKTYGRNLFPFLLTLMKQKVPIVYFLLKETFDLSYDDLVLVQRCPTVFLFVLLCTLDDFGLTILLRDVFKEEVTLSRNRQSFSILTIPERWGDIFESNLGLLFSKFNRSYLPIFEDMISTCVRGCYDCAHISFGCKYPIQEQEFRLNTYLTRQSFSRLRRKHSFKFPETDNDLQQALEKVKREEALYFYFLLEGFPRIEKLFNTFLSKCLTYDIERCQPLFIFDVDGNKIKVFVKMRKRIKK